MLHAQASVLYLLPQSLEAAWRERQRRHLMSLTEQTLPTGTWELDPVHSKASFAVKHAGLSTFRGHFNELTAALTDESGQPTLTGAVKVDSVEVPVDQLKGHLQGPDFFDAERHPEI